jgi:hypothetical protein
MAIVSMSDILISLSLIVNSLALMTPNYYRDYDESIIAVPSDYFTQTALRFKALMMKIRRLSCLLIVWNVLFIFLMAFVFT